MTALTVAALDPLGILQSAMDAIITVDENESILLFNTAAERIFGWPVAAALGAPLERLIPERFRAGHHRHIKHFGETGTTTRRMGARLTLYGLRANGEEFPIDASISQVRIGDRKLYTVILRDMADAKRSENALQSAYHDRRTANEQLLGIIQSAMDAIITVDAAQRIVVFNETAARMFRCRAEEAMGSPLERFIPERYRAAHRDHVARFGETSVTARMMGARLDLFGLRADGEEFPIDASISQVTVDGEKLYTVILRDVSERRRAEEALERSYGELRELSRVMNEVREAERTRVARELHDELAQWLTALKMDVAWLAARLPAGQHNLVDRTERMKGVVDTTIASVRRIAADLRPVMLDDLGLVPSIESLLGSLAERANIAVKLDVQPRDLDLKDPLATAIYRMVQEALTNVARHAQATEACITLGRNVDALTIRVCDNGVGLPPPVPDRKSYGVLGIRERAQTLGGNARIYSPPEGGTVVEISIPLARYAGAEAAT